MMDAGYTTPRNNNNNTSESVDDRASGFCETPPPPPTPLARDTLAGYRGQALPRTPEPTRSIFHNVSTPLNNASTPLNPPKFRIRRRPTLLMPATPNPATTTTTAATAPLSRSLPSLQSSSLSSSQEHDELVGKMFQFSSSSSSSSSGRPEDVPVPTIELSDLDTSTTTTDPTTDLTTASATSESSFTEKRELEQGFLSPHPHALTRMVSPPKTPAAQIRSSFQSVTPYAENYLSTTSRARDWSGAGHSISRPSSALSQNSNSTASSFDSCDSMPSYGGSCTSPESDAADPFIFPEAKSGRELLSPLHFDKKLGKRSKMSMRKVKWTAEMDDHLWITYLAYLADPLVTPFRAMPGSAPPLGVCYRVAREAKKSWKGPRSSPAAGNRMQVDEKHQQATSADSGRVKRESPAPSQGSGSSDTLRLASVQSSNDSARKILLKWPRSEASTRKRLRDLCKRKPQFVPSTQQHLRATRTPSPFEPAPFKSPRSRISRLRTPMASGAAAPASYPPAASTSAFFNTRDLNVNLAASTAKSMQPDGPLSQLSFEASLGGPSLPSQNQNVDWLGQSTFRSSAHQKSQSLQLGLGLGGSSSVREYRRLASPFQEQRHHRTWHMQNSSASRNLFHNADSNATIRQPPPRLDSPLEIHAPRPMSGSMKRRAQYQLGRETVGDEPDPQPDYFLQNLFRRPVISQSERAVRHRGFSLGAVHQTSAGHADPSNRPPLTELFTPPPTQDFALGTPFAQQPSQRDVARYSTPTNFPLHRQQHQQQQQYHHHHHHYNQHEQTSGFLDVQAPTASLDNVARLGSPFAPDNVHSSTNVGLRNTFPRSLYPQRLNVFGTPTFPPSPSTAGDSQQQPYFGNQQH